MPGGEHSPEHVVHSSSDVSSRVPIPFLMSNVPVPPKLQMSGDLPITWRQWRQIWNAYELVTKLNKQSDKY